MICLLLSISGCMMAPTVVADKTTIGDTTRTAGTFVSLADISTRK